MMATAQPLSTADLFAYAGGVLLMLSFLPQIWTTWRIKSGTGLSLSLILLTTFSTMLILVYGFMAQLTPVIIINTLFLVSNLILLVLKVIFDLRAAKADKAARPAR